MRRCWRRGDGAGEYELVFHVGDYFGDASISRPRAGAIRITDASAELSRAIALLTMGLQHLSRELMRRCDELGAISDEPGRLTRTFHSPAMQRANALVGSWMRDAGLEVREDAAFNLIGRWPSAQSTREDAAPRLASRHGARCREIRRPAGRARRARGRCNNSRRKAWRCPFHVEVIGFSDEEGVRYQTTYLGSRALAGTLTKRDLARD